MNVPAIEPSKMMRMIANLEVPIAL